ncbi:unnamed protein product [Rotaria sordida]|uniref:Uncharacterized protein n=1 Tax=Rotaria sordida TaxID=392033 RepID=A0A819HHB7_9BILA|nr:unnamed protein product [Rotaria sordida]CAF3900027.1 unnamed protein product [Rotaria sordida]
MATCTTNDPHEIQMDSESEVDSDMEIDEVNSSDINSDESDDEAAPPKKQSIDRNWSKTAFEPHLFHFDEQNSGVSLDIHAMKRIEYYKNLTTVILDTEGLMSLEESGTILDNQIIAMAILSSHLVIINHKGNQDDCLSAD